MNCLHCGAETTNGLALCELARRKVEADLEYLPVYFANLARWSRPARPNGSLGSRGQWLLRRGASDGNRIGRALDETGTDLVGWARQLQDDRDVVTPGDADDEATTVRWLCAHLAEHLTSIATCDWAGDFVQATGMLEADLRALTEQVAPGWYAGECRRCQHPTHVVPGLTWVTCTGCGATTYARDHLEQVLAEARGWVARPKPMAEAIVALVDTEQSVSRVHDRIRAWESRGRLSAVRALDRDGDPTGPKRYRFGEVLDLVLGTNVTARRIEGTTAV
jgi:hypothetical protein